MKTLKILAFILVSINAFGQSDNFPNLKKINIVSSDLKATFGFDPNSFALINKKCTDLPKSDFLWCEDDELEEFYKLGDFKSDKLKHAITIGFTFGMSVDPEFILFNSKNKIIGRVYAWNLYLNSNGVFYTSGHVNNFFDQKRKFEINGDTIIEIKQPFYHVGLKSTTKEQITLYSDKRGGEVVAVLPKNYEIEILLAEYGKNEMGAERYFLVKTKFGLVGWINYESPTAIEGLYYAGD